MTTSNENDSSRNQSSNVVPNVPANLTSPLDLKVLERLANEFMRAGYGAISAEGAVPAGINTAGISASGINQVPSNQAMINDAAANIGPVASLPYDSGYMGSKLLDLQSASGFSGGTYDPNRILALGAGQQVGSRPLQDVQSDHVPNSVVGQAARSVDTFGGNARASEEGTRRFDQKARAFEQGTRADDQSTRANHQGSRAYDQSARAYDQGSRAYDQSTRAYDQGSRAYDQGSRAFDKNGSASVDGYKQAFGFLNEIRSLVPEAEVLGALSPFQTQLTHALQVETLKSSLPEWQSTDASVLAGEVLHLPGAPYSNFLVPLSSASTYLQPARGRQGSSNLNVDAIRRDFPILSEKVNGRDLIWLDNAATTQKPRAVIDRLSYFYSHENSNIHRSAHELAARSSDAYEQSRETVRQFLNASTVSEIIFVRGATEGINLVAQTWGRQNINENDEIVISHLEHHANIVPWQMLCEEKGAKLKVAPVNDAGEIIVSEFQNLLGPKTKLVSFTHVSNALGTVTPAAQLIELAHRNGARVLLDGAQSISHMPVDVQFYDCDFFVFSGHKVYAPTGIGVVYAKQDILEGMKPWHGGGNMIHDVRFERTIYQNAPARFEAGTGNIADAVGLGAAIDYLQRIGMNNVAKHEHELIMYALEGLKSIPGLRVIGAPVERAGVISFVLDGFRNEDVSRALNAQGLAVRSGHHCAQPILRRLGVEGTVRPSFGIYNTCEEVDALILALANLTYGRFVS
jgi:cysteine desulfurase/selenocysteine lyase